MIETAREMFMSKGEVSRFAQVSRNTITAHGRRGTLVPVATAEGNLCVLYLADDVARWREKFLHEIRAFTPKKFRRAAARRARRQTALCPTQTSGATAE